MENIGETSTLEQTGGMNIRYLHVDMSTYLHII